jgi:hypothetical protein
MRRAISFWPFVLLALLIAGCGQSVGVAPPSAQQSAAGMNLTDLHDISDLQARFNQDVGKPRLVLLVSPT